MGVGVGGADNSYLNPYIKAYTIDNNKFVPRCHLFNRLVWLSYYQAFDSLYYQAITKSSLKGKDQYNRPPCTN